MNIKMGTWSHGCDNGQYSRSSALSSIIHPLESLLYDIQINDTHNLQQIFHSLKRREWDSEMLRSFAHTQLGAMNYLQVLVCVFEGEKTKQKTCIQCNSYMSCCIFFPPKHLQFSISMHSPNRKRQGSCPITVLNPLMFTSLLSKATASMVQHVLCTSMEKMVVTENLPFCCTGCLEVNIF